MWHLSDMPTASRNVCFRGQSGKHLLAASISPFDPGCVKTCTSRECAELFSLFSSFDGDCQSGSFVIQRNRDKLSTRTFDVGVFTQPGSKGEILAASRCFPLFSRYQTFGASARYGMPKACRFTLQIPACVTVRAIDETTLPLSSSNRNRTLLALPRRRRSRLPDFALGGGLRLPSLFEPMADRLADLPDGLLGSSAVQPCLQKYFRSCLT